MNDLPSYDDLPRNSAGVPLAWHLFGGDDNMGMFNLQTPQAVANAAALVRKGSVFSLNAPVNLFTPSLAPARSAARHKPLVLQAPWLIICDDVIDNFFPQGSSQWDSLAHVSADASTFYNGATLDEVRAGERNGIEHWARRGIAGRAILLDLEALQPDYDRGTPYAFTVDDLEQARTAAGVEYQPGDVIILNTGFADWYSGLSAFERMGAARAGAAPGVESSEDVCRYLWDAHPAAVASDTFGFEVTPASHSPADAPFGFIHQVLIGGLGIALGELWWLKELVADCRADGNYECFVTSAPLNVPGGTGSPANALAIK